MKKTPIRRLHSKEGELPPDSTKEQDVATSASKEKKVMAKKKQKNEMSVYGKYSNFVENTLSIGRNGKRVLHGGAAAAGTWAAGHYGGVEVINNNMTAALVGGAAVGVVGTIAMDHLFLSDEDQASLLLSAAQQASDEVQAELLKELGLDGEDMSIKSLIEMMRKTG